MIPNGIKSRRSLEQGLLRVQGHSLILATMRQFGYRYDCNITWHCGDFRKDNEDNP